uniref:Uncharacterized protein n=1 Tax=uncultured Armatimonadetes bacterium TaxID=157466 RepID=A0A6J4JPD8_9BACT|nr:hypothetical protein AVDCRST_MAG63-3740 [uncultured Armatimonadetes bacterium]
MTITIELAPDEEARLRQKADEQRQEIGEYVRTLVRREAAALPGVPPAASGEAAEATATGAYDPAAAIALLEEFATSEEWGTAEEQRETLEFLKKAIDEDRPGQRRIFGEGVNPA